VLRYYERQGLLSPTREPNGYRVYTDDDVTTVRQIRFLLAAGLSTRHIGRLLRCLGGDAAAPVITCPDGVSAVRRQRARLRAEIRALDASHDILGGLIADSGGHERAAKVPVTRRVRDVGDLAS
jgi:DNA-binding transcriptional MerR regulator